jgi:ribose transport system permease protein
VLIATVSNGMNVLGVQSYWQPLVIGLIILGGVTLDTYRRRISFGELARRFGRHSAQTVPAAPAAGPDR